MNLLNKSRYKIPLIGDEKWTHFPSPMIPKNFEKPQKQIWKTNLPVLMRKKLITLYIKTHEKKITWFCLHILILIFYNKNSTNFQNNQRINISKLLPHHIFHIVNTL
jgi:hypothetical protein